MKRMMCRLLFPLIAKMVSVLFLFILLFLRAKRGCQRSVGMMRLPARAVPVFALCAMLFALCAPPAEAKVWTCALPSDVIGSTTGVTTAGGSGVSAFELDGVSGATVFDLAKYEDKDLLTFEISSLRVWNSPATGNTPAYTNATAAVSFFWRESQTKDGLATAEKHPIALNVSLASGASVYQIPFRVSSANYGQLLFQSYCTAWAVPVVYVKAGAASAGVYIAPVMISTHSSAFGTGGTSQFWTGATAIPVAEGCRYVEVQPVGDAVHFTSDKVTTPTTSHTKIAAESTWKLTREEWEKFWMKPAGSAVGTLNVKQWTAKP